MANPHAADTPHWEAAFEHFYQDRIEAAYEEILPHGVGEGAELLRWYRIIEAEAITRAKSSQLSVASWLTFEYVPDETLRHELEWAQSALDVCDEVAKRLGWTHSVQTHLAILAEETDAPWATSPYGYCISKVPFEKICLPNYLLDDPNEFRQAVAHEYAHVISTNIAEDYAPRWVEEAISVLVERTFDRETWLLFCEDPQMWLEPIALEHMLTDRTDDDESKDDIWNAYQQSGWIGRYLASLHGELKLGEFLHEIANEAPLINVWRLLKQQDRTEYALHKVFGLSTSKLFNRAYTWMKLLPPEEQPT